MKTQYQAEKGESPLWAAEPFRLFFPLGIAAAVFGLALWPLHYAGWWELYPALQHPRILIFGFGSAFIFGFLGTAWPRFLESEALQIREVMPLVGGWLFAQLFYASGAIAGGDLAGGVTGVYFLYVLGRRLSGEGREWPPPGFALAFFAVLLASVTLLAWGTGWGKHSPEASRFLRLVGYQGFLLLPILGVGSYLFPRFFSSPGVGAPGKGRRSRGFVVWGVAGLVLVSFAVEVWLSIRWGNGLRLFAVVLWIFGTLPEIATAKAPGTRPWALRFGLLLILAAFLCRFVWPLPTFAFEHLLFLAGFCQVMLLVADRVVLGHCDDPALVPARSIAWRWIVWLLLLTAATRATSDLVPTTRVSHHIYAALLMIVILAIWTILHAKRLGKAPPDGE